MPCPRSIRPSAQFIAGFGSIPSSAKTSGKMYVMHYNLLKPNMRKIMQFVFRFVILSVIWDQKFTAPINLITAHPRQGPGQARGQMSWMACQPITGHIHSTDEHAGKFRISQPTCVWTL